MSYDVGIGEALLNYTYNLGKFFHAHIGEGEETGIQALDGKTGAQGVVLLSDAFERIERTRHRFGRDGTIGEPDMCAEYDAANGWGSTVGAIVFLGQILAACAADQEAVISVC